jgi:hypothetical protein
MPGTIIDSLFLELGIDTSRLSSDQVKALTKINEFETRAKRAGKGGADAVKSVGDAFRDLAKSTGIGSGVTRIEDLSKKVTGLGKSLSVAGGVGAPLGAVTRGIGALLSPTALWGAAIGGVGVGMWELNKVMTANNAAIDRQAQLTGTSAANMWSWAEAAKTVGANPMEISGGIAGLQTAIMGMGIGVGNATGQLIGLARLGVPFNFRTGANIEALFTRVNAMAAQRKFGIGPGSQPLGSLQALAQQAGMNEAMWALASNPTTTPADIKKWIETRQSVDLGKTLTESLKSQTILGKLGIEKDILAETAYGGEQGLMQAVVELLTKLLDLTNTLVTYVGAIVHAIPGAWNWVSDKVAAALDAVALPGTRPAGPLSSEVSARQAEAMKYLMARGVPSMEAAAMVGNMTQESGMDPMAVNASGHRGLEQWDRRRQANFERFAGYRMGPESGVPANRQTQDMLAFSLLEPEYQKAREMMAKTSSLADATLAFQHFDEVVYDASGAARFKFAQAALTAAATNNTHDNSSTVTHHTRIGDIHIASDADTGVDMARDMRRSLATQPLLGPLATATMTLSTRGSQ